MSKPLRTAPPAIEIAILLKREAERVLRNHLEHFEHVGAFALRCELCDSLKGIINRTATERRGNG